MGLMADVRAALLAMDAVTALVGTGATARIRPFTLDESDDLSESHIVIDIDSETPQNDISGVGGLVYASVTVSCRALRLQDANALAQAVRVNGTDPGTGLAGITAATFDAVLDSTATGITWYGDHSQRKWHDVAQDYTMSFSETT